MFVCFAETYRKLKFNLLSVSLNLLRMVKPLDLHHHVAVPRLPQQLHLTDVGPIDAGRRQKDGAVTDVQDFRASLDGSVEQLLGLALAAGSAVAFVKPVPERSAGDGVDAVDVRLFRLSNL